MKRLFLLVPILCTLSCYLQAQELPPPFCDNFNEGEIGDWECVLGSSIQAEPWPVVDGKLCIDLPAGGSNSADAKPPGVVLEDFVVEAEVQRTPWTSGNFGTGLLARFNSGNGYFHSLRSDFMRIYVIGGGSITELANAPVDGGLISGESLRLVFTGRGENLTAQAYTLENELVSEIEATHRQWTTGRVGVVNVTRGTVACFDNFKAYHPDNPPKATIEVIIETSDANAGTVTSTPSGPVEPGTVITIQATPEDGYRFVRWEGEGVAEPTSQRTELIVPGDGAIQAIFEKIQPPGSFVTVNPVIDGLVMNFQPQRGVGVEVRWSGGGGLQQLDETTQMMADVSTINPFLSTAAAGIFRISDRWAGGRATEIYVPASYHESEAMPLVIALHGFSPDPDYIESYFGLRELADRKGFLLAEPDGLLSLFQGRLGWNDGVPLFETPADDVEFLHGLILAASNILRVDSQRVYLYGHSNGGSVAYRTARHYSNLIAAVASLEGSPLILSGDPGAAEPVSILHIHGTDESDGGPSVVGGPFPLGGEIYSVEALIREWGAVAGHDMLERDPDKTLDLQANLPGLDTTVTRMTGGASGIAVEFWEIKGSKHFSPGSHDDFSENVIDWLLAHPKPGK